MNTKNRLTIDTTADRIYAFKASCRLIANTVGIALIFGGIFFFVAIMNNLFGN